MANNYKKDGFFTVKKAQSLRFWAKKKGAQTAPSES